MSARRSKKDQDRLPPNTPLGRYWLRTHRPLNSLVFVLPLIIIYEIGMALANNNELLARNQMGEFLRQFGASAGHLPAVLVATVLLGSHVAQRQKWAINGQTVVVMLAESILWAIPLLGIGLVGRVMAAATVGADPSSLGALANDLLVGLGGGIYEEFLFRLVGLNLCTLILLDVLELPKDIGYLVAVGTCAVLFALYHFVSQDFSWRAFAFYSMAGIYLGTLYIMRGYGVSVGTHVCYNMMAVLTTVVLPH